MSLRDLLALYLVVGVACAIAVFHRASTRSAATFASALITVPLWPLWAPFALAPKRGPRPSGRGDDSVVRRVERALADAVEAVQNTPMAAVFTKQTADRIATEVNTVATRIDDLETLAEQSGFDLEASAQSLEDLQRSGASERAVATARLQHDSLERLARLRSADAHALEELAELLEGLRTQLVLARYAGSSADGASAIVSEVWSRLEGLGAALDQTT